MNYKFAGAGVIPAGEYEEVSVSGSARADGSIRCTGFKASGSFKGEGALSCTGEMHFSGSAAVKGDVEAAVLKTSGAFKCEGSLRGGRLSGSGAVSVTGGIEGDEVRLSGSVRCGGLLNAEQVELELGDDSQVGSIGGSHITVRPGPGRRGLFRRGVRGALLTVEESIEGDRIALESVAAPQVVGRVVTVGPGCRIRLLQYSESAEVSPDAQVEKSEKI